MIRLIKTDASNLDFINLVKHLDVYLAKMDGDAHEFYDQYNRIENLKEVIVVYKNGEAVACGAIKPFDAVTVEVKRMYVNPDYRGEGIATTVLLALEKWALEIGFSEAILETGNSYHDAIALYIKNGYFQIPNYGQYVESDLSACYKKYLKR